LAIPLPYGNPNLKVSEIRLSSYSVGGNLCSSDVTQTVIWMPRSAAVVSSLRG
jgi:hypothetical protein